MVQSKIMVRTESLKKRQINIHNQLFTAQVLTAAVYLIHLIWIRRDAWTRFINGAGAAVCRPRQAGIMRIP